ncbi:MAG: HD domain-containing protein [Lachnospiraceae bacterium]|nr:HD domain-containing protein [Lachnospiraceae bacterium]
MKKEDIMSKKEKQANIEMSYIFLIVILLMAILIVFEVLGIFILPKIKTIICSVIIIVMAIIPVYVILVLKINERWVKYMVIVGMSLIVAAEYVIFTFYIVVALCIPILVASVYNSKKVMYTAVSTNVLILFVAHILAPIVTLNVDDPFYTVTRSLLYGFFPRALVIIAVALICYFNILRFDSTINNILEYGEDLEKSTNGLKRIFIECHDMIMTESDVTFIQSVGGSLFRIIKFLQGTRENVKSIIVLKNDENDGFLAINELYERQDDKVSEDERFLYVEYGGKKIKIVKENIQNEGNCVTCDDSIIMTFYDQDQLVGFILVDATLDMNVNSNSVTMSVLYNSIKLCISTKQAQNQMRESQEKLIYQFSKISESKSEETGHHIKRVSEYMRVFGKSICKSHRECDDLACAAMLHDVGKLIVPSAVLDKPGKLTPEEFSIIKEHTKYGGALLKDVPGKMMKIARNIAMQHHERWDGTGYNALKGEEIDFYSRYVSVIDVFDALISKRCYKPAWTLDDAYNEIVNNSGTQFAPEAVELFKEKYEELLEVYRKYPDAIEAQESKEGDN